ncbi:MAG TPA: VOC family protein [Candidatus Nitrosocosmicus sp.]|nr:VOC family protein [Candidatus Nitrosocosmicus sp.]
MSKTSINTINYFEIPSDYHNQEQIKNFYESVFGWHFEKGKDTPDYLYTESAGIKGALLKKRAAENNSITLFIQVNSIDECITKAKEAGARVIIEKQEISEGIFAILKDPMQNSIGIWESKLS